MVNSCKECHAMQLSSTPFTWAAIFQESKLDAFIRQAIAVKQVISFDYKGHQRIVEPHIYGRKDGVLQILGYQIGGRSSQGKLPDWRRFDLPLMRGLQLHGSGFPGAREVHARHSAWDVKFVIVAP